MVTTPTDPDANPLIQETEALNRESSDIIQEIEVLDQAEAERAEAPPVPVEEVVPAPEIPTEPVPPAEPPQVPGLDVNALRQQLQRQEMQLRQYEFQERELALDREVLQYQGQLEAQGLMEEQAKPVAQQYKQFRQRELQIQQAAQNRELNNLGKFYAALHYGQVHAIDPRELMQYDSPQAMESAAKAQAKLKSLETQIQKLTQQQVPPSTYETGQPAPSGARSVLTWLTAYNDGDRSPQAIAAAKRAAGQ